MFKRLKSQAGEAVLGFILAGMVIGAFIAYLVKK